MKSHISWIVTIAVAVLIIGSISWYSSMPGKYDGLAQCLGEKGATFFGAFWCPHCQEQKAVFGRSASKLPYTECSTPDGRGQLEICKSEGIESYPTWEFADGTRQSEVLSIAELSNLTGCPIDSAVQ